MDDTGSSAMRDNQGNRRSEDAPMTPNKNKQAKRGQETVCSDPALERNIISPRTPSKIARNDISSPSAKRALNFDFWGEVGIAKRPKVDQEDMPELEISDLTVKASVAARLTMRCTGIFDSKTVVKLACDDGVHKICVIAFGENMSLLRGLIKVNMWFTLSQFDVKKEHPAYPQGSFKELEILLNLNSKIQQSPERDIPLPTDNISISDAMEQPDGSVVDILALVVKNWGLMTTSSGHSKLDLSLTDKSKKTVRLTTWSPQCDQLVGIESSVIAINRATVMTYDSFKFLQTRWMTAVDASPTGAGATELQQWFSEQMQQIG